MATVVLLLVISIMVEMNVCKSVKEKLGVHHSFLHIWIGVRYSPTVILFSIDVSTANATSISQWSYPTNDTTWQAGLTNLGVDQYAARFGMSVSINPSATQVLVGVQWMNMVLLFSYSTTTLTLVTLKDNGHGTAGFGKGVAWFGDSANSFAILANVYSRSYDWSSSKIYIYNSPLTNISNPTSIFPNIQQPLYSYMSSVFLNIITTPTHLVLLDELGYLFVILSAPEGYYASTIGPIVEIVPAVSSQMPCTAGTYKNMTGIMPCSLCPPGTKNGGTNATSTTCATCATNTFCPLGSVTDSISNDELSNVIQAVAYPKSPDISGLDDILFFTLFSIGSTPRCIALSPIFWTLIVAAIVLVITTIILVIKYCVRNSKAAKINNKFVKLFKRTDLIREGNMWAGGLATFCVLVLCIACCVFSAKYYTSYPIETAEPSTYTCDTSLRNAKFSSSLQSSSIPVSESMQQMIDLLNDQAVNLNVAFINTVYNCTSDAVTLTFFSGAKFLPVALNPSCNWSNYIVFYSVLLPFKRIVVQFTLPNIHTIGGLRIGLTAPGDKESATLTLQELGFSYTFNKTGRMLGQDAYITFTLTKLINSTSSLVSGGGEVLSGIWTGSFTMNYNDSFVSDTDYLTASSNDTATHLTLEIIETPYYILNEQSPIARLPEIIYHDFLFITMIIGMFVLIFIIIEVMILPCCTFLIGKCRGKSSEEHREDSSRRSSASHSDKQDSTQHKRDDAMEQTPVSNRYVNRSNYEEQDLPSEWNRQAHF